MDIFTALKERRSCRSFKNLDLEEDKLQRILQAGAWAPSVG